jgi:hypothetical protein
MNVMFGGPKVMLLVFLLSALLVIAALNRICGLAG